MYFQASWEFTFRVTETSSTCSVPEMAKPKHVPTALLFSGLEPKAKLQR